MSRRKAVWPIRYKWTELHFNKYTWDYDLQVKFELVSDSSRELVLHLKREDGLKFARGVVRAIKDARWIKPAS